MSTIKNDYQKLIAEAYVISLFISDIAHPTIIPIWPKGSGKSLLLRLIALIVDPRVVNINVADLHALQFQEFLNISK